MEQPKTNPIENAENEETFINYMQELFLHPKDLEKGEILDIGSGSAGFAKWAKDHRITSQIYSLDSAYWNKFKEKSKSVYAKAQAIPFKDGTFSIVLANHVPFVYCPFGEDPERIKEIETETKNAILEIIRVLKPGGEARFHFFDYGNESAHTKSVSELLKELKKEGYEIEFLNPSTASKAGSAPKTAQSVIRIVKPDNVKI